ncbi:DVU_1555 family C-GCAxxG-C-C protein [Propionivibrio soli]|uniref:DVU_1555 family C-GCAxxG-C-C protein n=1 Tax=Propionivibrio soli TaxID=2976531 RepID=UPI0021E795AE|nr:DV_1555 family C-GCAxxG-C-C protein [Propionivibrio soli]
MNNDDFRVAELTLKGYKCSHILVQIGLDALGKDNPELLRAMSGLATGLGCGLTCGALTGGCCLIGMYAGMDGARQGEHEKLPRMLEEYVDWFREDCEQRFGGSDCAQITGANPMQRAERCPGLILECVHKAREVLEANGFDLDGKSGEEQSWSNR